MSENSLAEKIAEQWLLMKQAPIPYVTALLILAGLMFAGFQWAYGRILEQKDGEISLWKGHATTVIGERDELKAKLADKSAPQQLSKPNREPDTLYQFGSAVARVPGGETDKATGRLHFPKILGGPDFNIAAEFDYRDIKAQGCQSAMTMAQGIAGIINQHVYIEVTCQILGARSP